MASQTVRQWWFMVTMSIACAAMSGCTPGTSKPGRVGDAVSGPRQAVAESAPVAPPYDNKLDPKGKLSKIDTRPDMTVVYKTVPGYGALKLYVYLPRVLDNTCNKPVVMLIHGGGWGVGTPHMLGVHAGALRQHGYAAITVQYRLNTKENGYTPFDCVQDVKSAMRYIRKHACEWAGDSKRVVALGESAGGQLAAACALLTDINDPADDTSISAVPEALVLYDPVLDTAEPDGWKWREWSGEAGKKVAPRAKELSPTDHVVNLGGRPTLIIHGDADTIAPLRWSEAFTKKMRDAGNPTELVVLRGRKHAFAIPGWSDEKTIAETLDVTVKFLIDRNIAPPTGNGAVITYN